MRSRFLKQIQKERGDVGPTKFLDWMLTVGGRQDLREIQASRKAYHGTYLFDVAVGNGQYLKLMILSMRNGDSQRCPQREPVL